MSKFFVQKLINKETVFAINVNKIYSKSLFCANNDCYYDKFFVIKMHLKLLYTSTIPNFRRYLYYVRIWAINQYNRRITNPRTWRDHNQNTLYYYR